jgi:hypothetical protein
VNKGEKPNQRGKFRRRKATIALLVILAMTTVSCTPGQIEGVFTQLATPFESGYDLQSVEAGLFQTALVLSYLIPGMGLGPGFAF